jgi:small-conductance mechanosensitive channel
MVGTAQSVAPRLPEWLFFPGWEVAVAVVIVLLGAYLSKFAVRLLGRPVAKRFERPSVAQMMLRLLRVVVVGVSALVAMRVVGFPIGDIALSVTVFSAVLGIVLAPIAGSIINGLFVLADQPYENGDMIELDDGTQGFVEEVTIRYTKVMTLDNTFLVIPNSTIRERDVVNYSAEDERTRLSLTVQVTYESDVGRARDLLERAARGVEDVVEGGPDIRVGSARYPATPTCYIDAYADSGVDLTLRYWGSQPYRLLALRSAVQERAWELLEDADDVEVAYPHQQLVFDDTSGTARVAVEPATERAGADATEASPVKGDDPDDGSEGPGDGERETDSEENETDDGGEGGA